MQPAERGIYCTIIFVLYDKGGYVKFNRDLAAYCNCSYAEFRKIWSIIKTKFGKKKDKIFHSKVLKELAVAKARSQVLSESGLRGANKRWKNDSEAMPEKWPGNAKRSEEKRSEAKIRNDKLSEANVNEQEASISDSASKNNSDSSTNSARLDESHPSIQKVRINSRSLKFADYLNKHLTALTRSDRTAFNNIINHLTHECQSGYFSMDIFDKAQDLINEAKKGENPNALFMSLARKFLNYKKR